MARYLITVEIHDDDRGPEDGGTPWTAVAYGPRGEGITMSAGLGTEPWETLADLEISLTSLTSETRVEDVQPCAVVLLPTGGTTVVARAVSRWHGEDPYGAVTLEYSNGTADDFLRGDTVLVVPPHA